jgi:hypothetical protein
MKYLAVLKDSLREAIDTKVFLVMVVISVLMTLVGASMSFTTETSPGTMNRVFEREFFRGQFEAFRRGQQQTHGIRDVHAVPLDGTAEGPDRSYRVAFRVQFQDQKTAARLKASIAAARTWVRTWCDFEGENLVFRVTDVRLPKPDRNAQPGMFPNSVRIEVTTRPTSFTRLAWPHQARLFFGTVDLGPGPLGVILFTLENYLVSGFGAWIAIIVSIVITAFFIPNMLRKGTIDLLLVKPIHRPTLLLYKFVGGLTFIFLNTMVAVGGVWAALSLRAGVWAPGFLISILTITFFFAILYAVSTLFGVLTQSPITGILMALLTVGVLTVVGWIHWTFEERRQREQAGDIARTEEGPWHATIDVLHAVLPRVRDLDYLTARTLSRELLTEMEIRHMRLNIRSITWAESVTVSLAFIAVLLGVACWRFSARDY